MKRQQRTQVFRPRAEGLESRTLLSADIGVNLGTNSIYENEPIWTDVHNLAAAWTLTGNPSGSVPLTADNYPLANAWTQFDLGNYPDGDYQLSYTGSATVNFWGDGQLAGPVTTGANGVTTGTVVVHHSQGGNFLYMSVFNINTANPMDNFHLYMPGYSPSSNQMFTNAFLQQLQPFSTIRFLNWTLTNDSYESTWSLRTPPNSFVVADTTPVPWEDIIELGNEAHKDIWINIPVEATPNYIQNLAQLFAARLDPGLHVYLEYGNENWNSTFWQYNQVYTIARSNPLVSQSAGQYVMVAQQSAYEMVAIARAFDQAFGARSAQVRPIFAGFTDDPRYQQWALQFIQQNYGAPSQYLWGMAIYTYAGIPNDTQAGLTLNEIFSELESYITGGLTSALQTNAAIAHSYGLSLVGYEGGQSLGEGGTGSNYNLELQAQSDPRMFQVYINLIHAWEQAGGGLLELYSLWGDGFWGLLPNILATGSQKWNAVMTEILPLGDANLDGTVDYPDLQILLANSGQTNAGWDQGDFNDDGVVNWADLNILRGNLNPSGFTLAQFAQAALAGQPSAVTALQPVEYDGYGVTYASNLPLVPASGSATVQPDATSAGAPIILAGQYYTKGLGVKAGSSVTIPLDGQYSRFQSTLGVDGWSDPSSSAVVFQVYGDGRLLYQSSTITLASGGIPIDVNVAGVQSLNLVVAAAPGSNSATDHAVWADARLISTSNFGATTPYTLTWQLAQAGRVISTRTTDSYLLDAPAPGTYTLSVTVADASGDTATASTVVTVTPGTPTLAAIPAQSMTAGRSLTLSLQGSDPNGLPLTDSASVDSLAYHLKSTLGLYEAGSFYTNYYGGGEQWVAGSGGAWYYILPSGAFYQWSGSGLTGTLVAQLGPSYNANPSLLVNAQPGQGQGSVSLSGSTLTITPAAGFAGLLAVTATVSNGHLSASQTFQLTVIATNAPPVLAAIPAQATTNVQSLTLTLQGSGPAGLPLTYSARADSLAYHLKSTLGLYEAGSFYTNSYGGGEQWVAGSGGAWYYILPSGGFYRWSGSGLTGTLIAQLGPSYDANPSLLVNAQPGQGQASVNLSGSILAITPDAGFTGLLYVTAIVSNSNGSTSQAFPVTVTAPPILAAIANQTVAFGQGLTLSLQGSDPNGLPLTDSASVDSLAYHLKSTLGLYSTGDYYTNAYGGGEQWVQGTGGVWYYILPSGAFYKWSGSGLTGTFVAQLDPSYNANPSLLVNAQPGQGQASVSLSGSTLTITPNAGFTGLLYVTATVSDGPGSASQTFVLTVSPSTALPTLAAIPAQATTNVQSLTLSLQGSGPAGLPLTYSARVDSGQASVRLSGSTLTITPAAGFTGLVYVTAMVSNANGSASQTFPVTVTDVPALAAIANQSVAAGQSLTLSLQGSDPAGLPLTYSATVDSLAYHLEITLGLFTTGNYWTNSYGGGEQWVAGSGGAWYYILPSGGFYRWSGSGLTGTLIAQLGPSYNENPRLLVYAQPGQGQASVSVSGSTLTITPDAGFTGPLFVTATDSNGPGSASQKFQLTVTS